MSLYDEVWREAMADYRAADLDESYRWTPEMAVKKARQLGVSPQPFLDAVAERADLDRRVDRGEFEGEWLERQETRDVQ